MDNWIKSRRAKFLCALLRERRESAGLKQDRVAKSLGVYQSYVSVYEDGQKRLDFFQLQRVAKALKTTRHSLLLEFEEDAPPEEYADESAEPEQDSAVERAAWETVASLDPGEADAAVRLGQLLKTLRKSAKVRQKDIADPLGKPQSWVSKYERGKVRLDVIQLGEVAFELDTTLHALDERLEERPAEGAQGKDQQ